MVRATRATQLALEDPPVPAETNLSPTSSSPSSHKKAPGRKRKRNSSDEEHDREPLTASQVKEVNGGGEKQMSEEDGQEGDKEVMMVMSPKLVAAKRQKITSVQDEEATDVANSAENLKPRHQDAGDAILSNMDARNLLAILEHLDGADLLERQLTQPSARNVSTSNDAKAPVSLRSMLADPANSSLRILSNAIRALSSKASLPRSNTFQLQAIEQRFLDTALGLLNQIASQHAGAIDPARTNLDPDVDESTRALAEDSHPTKKYALYQQLPSGGFFTSATSMASREAASLSKGQASLVSIQPTITLDPSLLPKLGSYSRTLKSTPIPPNRLPVSRRMAVGSFLDYGAYASFAPVFDSEAGEVGDQDLADYLYSKRVRKANRRTSLKATVAVVVDEDADTVMEIAPEKEESKVGSSSGSSSPATGLVIDPALEMEDELRAAMAQVQLETGIDDLLARNASAIQSLVQLQSERYKIGAKAPKVEVGGEEWKLAHAILATLTTLTSLRPRAAGSSTAPLIPAPAILRALHRTIPTDPIPGWKGTLARDRDVAYRDNSTITIGATPYVNPTPVAAPAPAPPPAQYAPSKAMHQQHAQAQQQQHQQPMAAQSYYAGQQYQHRPGMVGSPAQPQSYYGAQPHNAHAQAAYYAQQQAQAQAAAAYHASLAAAGKPPPAQQGGYFYNPYPAGYGYGYPQYPQQYAAPPGTPSMPGTPTSRAVPNLAKPGSYVPATAGWGTPMGGGGGGGGAGSALPMHLRTGPATPGTPTHGAYGGAAPVYPPMAGAYVPPPAAGYAAAWPPQKA